MLCKSPFTKDGLQHGCGQCLPCLINRRRKWTNRLMLEASLHKDNSFVTLTYAQLPLCQSVCRRHVQLFIKRLRNAFNSKIRYFVAGEYGSPNRGIRDWNPHYHLALFGYPACLYGRPLSERKPCTCEPCKTIQSCWPRGRTYNATLEPDSAQYIAQYVTKKMTNKYDPRLNGRNPEFASMSLKPALGTGAMEKIASIVQGSPFALDDLRAAGDVPYYLLAGSKKLPLDRTMRDKLRIFLGREAGLPADLLEKLKLEKCIEREQLLKEVNYDYKKYGQQLLRTQLIRSIENKFKRKESNALNKM